MSEKPARDEIERAWRSLPRPQRNELSVGARRGARPKDKTDAALTLWWAAHQLRRGPWPTFALAVAVVLAALIVELALGVLTWERVYGNPILGILLLIPFATWPSQRQRLGRALLISAGALTGKALTKRPADDEVDRLLGRAVKQGVLRKGRLAS